MSYDVEILAHSVAPGCPPLMTYRLRYPKQVHQEHLRHRALSFSVSSGRAVPAAKQLEAVRRDPAMPAYWGREQKGMSPGEPFTPEEIAQIERNCISARDACLDAAETMVALGVHKSLAGRYVYPWAHYEMICTGTEPGWMNFFALRVSKKADPTIRRLAVRMGLLYRDSVPEDVGPGGIHAPYLKASEREEVRDASGFARVRFAAHFQTSVYEDRFLRSDLFRLGRTNAWRHIKMSVARTGRVSFDHHGLVDRPEEKDLTFFDDRLKDGDWSVFEHVARAPFPGEDIAGLQGNLPGWIQLRQCLTPNVHTTFDFAILDQFPEDHP